MTKTTSDVERFVGLGFRVSAIQGLGFILAAAEDQL